MAINPYYYANPFNTSPYYVPQAPTFTANYPNLIWPTQFSQNPVQQSQTQAQPQLQSNIIWIKGGDDEAKMYPVAPNTAVSLWSESEPVIYLKQADATGKPTLKIFDLVERKESEAEAKDEPEAEYVQKSDMTDLVGLVKNLSDTVMKMQSDFSGTIENLGKDIDSIKGDMYGIAGKKRAPRKVEGEEDA